MQASIIQPTNEKTVSTPCGCQWTVKFWYEGTATEMQFSLNWEPCGMHAHAGEMRALLESVAMNGHRVTYKAAIEKLLKKIG